MKITTLIAAAAIATASTAATAQNVTTDAGELVIVEKNAEGGLFGMGAGMGGAVLVTFVAFVAAATGSK